MTTTRLSASTPQDLGVALRRARKARGLRQEDLALAAGVGLRFIGELERGKPTVRLAETLRVVSALGVELTIADPRG
jgi:y4mF family transcriptional regulator